MQLLHPTGDYHSHSLDFSDGRTFIDNLVKEAGNLGLTELAITDHSDVLINTFGFHGRSDRSYLLERWKNNYNDVNVIFGVEADLYHADGTICDTNQGMKGDFVILSAHVGVYNDDPKTITEAYCRAIQRHHRTIDVIGHLDHLQFANHVAIERVVQAANEYGVAIEFNTSYLGKDGTSHHTIPMLNLADKVMVNSDAHSAADLKKREKGLRFLQQRGYINNEKNI